MITVAVNAPRSAVTEGSLGQAIASVPNVCHTPLFPIPFPNIGESGKSAEGLSKDVTIDGELVAIEGTTFESSGDIASEPFGGGIITSTTEGVTAFAGPGSMDVKLEGKSVYRLGDPMLNNCDDSGSPANAATLPGILQAPVVV